MEFGKQIEYTFKKLIASVLRLSFKQPPVKPKPPFQRILFIRYGHIGDMILSVPVFRAARSRNDDMQIDVLCDINNSVPIKENQLINKIYFFEKSLFKIIKLIRKLQKEKYDYICNLTAYPSLTFGLLGRLIGPKSVRAGGDQEGYNFFYNRLIELPPKMEIHMLERLFKLSVDLTGGEVSHTDIPWLNFGEQIEKQAIELYMSIVAEANIDTDDPKIVIINLAAGLERREWPEEKYIKFLQSAVNNFKRKITGWAVITDLRKPDKANRIVQQLNIPSVVQIPQTNDYRVLMALLKHCYLIITPDTAFSHAASAMGTPVLDLMIGENETTWAPVGVKHMIISSDDPLSLKDLAVDKVLTRLDELIMKL